MHRLPKSRQHATSQVTTSTTGYECTRCGTKPLIKHHATIRDYISHLIHIHHIPILYYEEPIILRLAKRRESDACYAVVVRYGYSFDSYHILIIQTRGELHRRGTVSAVLYHIASQMSISYQFISMEKKNLGKQGFYQSLDAKMLWQGDYNPEIRLSQNNRMDFLFVMGDPTINEFKRAEFRPGCTLCCQHHYIKDCPLYAEFIESKGDEVSVETEHPECKKLVNSSITASDKVNKFWIYIQNFATAVTTAQAEYFNFCKTGGPVSPPPLSFGVLYPSQTFSADFPY